MNRTSQKIAEEMDALKDSGHELDGFERVEARVSPSPRAVVSLRLAEDELSEIEKAASTAHSNVSEYIRAAALEKARAGGPGDLASIGVAIEGLFRELASTYAGVGQPYGSSIDGLSRWLSEAVPQKRRRRTAAKSA